jgi:probable F420-dependent oxidoreductase
VDYWLAWLGQGNDHTVEVARAAERLGFAGVAIADHVAIPRTYGVDIPDGVHAVAHDRSFPDPLITAATMAASTRTLRFMTFAYILPMREPLTVAKQVATLAAQSGYRFSFGAGTGWHLDEIRLLGHDPRTRGRRMDEMLRILRDVWDDGLAEFHGDFYDFGPIGQFPVPTQRIPIWIGGESDAALSRAARHDGWLGLAHSVDETTALLDRLASSRRRFLDEGGTPAPGFTTAVMQDIASVEAYDHLAAHGLDAAVVRVWDTMDPAFDALEPKLEAMESFAARVIP